MPPHPDSSSELSPFSPSIEVLGNVLTSVPFSYQLESCLSLLSEIEGAAATQIRQMLQTSGDFSLEEVQKALKSF
ncbi:hypothetical protein NEPTK9_000600 [Candidatus Neptunochlamydia vexilliferae]|uniref:Uncharacterized protein n=2 Tax=Candidatus Neptunichlamydia vexilliferae TaxID=1651774 RepID=A0ABS0AY85_9BACT|nr:hypothetical protein [Candidatus Neptunochlamydia vexilliferae]